MPLTNYTSLLRKIDLNSPYNQFIVWLVVLLFCGMILYGAFVGASFERLAPRALELVLTVFLCWAIQRELDPDRPITAIVVAVFISIIWFLFQDTSLLLLAFMLMSTRSLTRSTGMRPRTLDLSVILLLGMTVSFFGIWPMAYLTAFFFFMAHMLEPDDCRYKKFAWTSFLIALPMTFLHKGIYMADFDSLTIVWAAIIIISAIAAYFRGIYTKSLCDKRGTALECKRLKAALAFTTVVVLVLLASFGSTALEMAYMLISCVIISSMANLLFPIRSELSDSKIDTRV